MMGFPMAMMARGGGGGGADYLWDSFPSPKRVHDAQSISSLSQTNGQQVVHWVDVGGLSLAAYSQTGGSGTGVTVATTNGLKYIQGGGTGGGYLEASANTDLRGSEVWVLFKMGAGDNRLASNQDGGNIWIRAKHGDLRISFGQTLYGVGGRNIPMSYDLTESQWYVVRIVFSENNGMEIWLDEIFTAGENGSFSSSPTATFKIPRLLADAAGSVSDAGVAFIGVFPATGETVALTAAQVASAWANLGALRDTFNGV
jgi:hypothetical protein